MAYFAAGGGGPGMPQSPMRPILQRTPSETVRRTKAARKYDQMSSEAPANSFDKYNLSSFEKEVVESICVRKERHFIDDSTFAKLEDIFYAVDTKKVGVINISNFKDPLQNVNSFKRNIFNKLVEFLDVNQDRQITFDEYLKVMILRALRWELAVGICTQESALSLGKLVEYTRELINQALEKVMESLQTVLDPDV